MRFLPLVLMTLIVAVPAPAVAAVDPLAPGPHATSAVEYDAQVRLPPNPGLGVPTQAYELSGLLHVPATTATGPRPVVVLSHGAHELCRVAGEDVAAPILLPACPRVRTPVVEDHPSYRGYAALGALLASHGYVVVSLNANLVQALAPAGGDFAERARLIRLTIDLLGEWHRGARTVPDGVGAMLQGRVDLTRIGLMGHSRGADAVGIVVGQPDRPAGIRAAVQVAAVDTPFSLANRAPAGVHLATILGSCDADTGTGGAALWDRGRFVANAGAFSRAQFLLMGANHNAFNSEWYDEWLPERQPLPLTPGPGNPACAPDQPTSRRLDLTDQHRLGTAVMAAFLRRYVGEETELDGLVTGRTPIAPFACPTRGYLAGRAPGCDDVLRSGYLAPASGRRMLLPTDAEGGGDGVLTSTGALSAVRCAPEAGEPCPEAANDTVAPQLTINWSGPGTLAVEPPAPVDAAPFDALTFRVAMNPSDARNDGTDALAFDVCLLDGPGRRACVTVDDGSPALRRQPAGDGTRYSAADPARRGQRSLLLTGVRVPLTAFADVDLGDLTGAELRFGARQATGSLQLAELALQSG